MTLPNGGVPPERSTGPVSVPAATPEPAAGAFLS